MPRSKIPYLLDGSGNMVPLLNGDVPIQPLFQPQMPPSPSRRGVTITGVSRDSTGAALGGCECVLLRRDQANEPTERYVEVERQTSDGSGNYSFSVVGPGEDYRVIFYLAGAPNRAGTTDRTLAGA